MWPLSLKISRYERTWKFSILPTPSQAHLSSPKNNSQLALPAPFSLSTKVPGFFSFYAKGTSDTPLLTHPTYPIPTSVNLAWVSSKRRHFYSSTHQGMGKIVFLLFSNILYSTLSQALVWIKNVLSMYYYYFHFTNEKLSHWIFKGFGHHGVIKRILDVSQRTRFYSWHDCFSCVIFSQFCTHS